LILTGFRDSLATASTAGGNQIARDDIGADPGGFERNAATAAERVAYHRFLTEAGDTELLDQFRQRWRRLAIGRRPGWGGGRCRVA